MTAGLKLADFQVVWGVDNEASPLEAFRANHPEVTVHEGDISAVNPQDVMHEVGLKRGDLDLLAGCPPCQGFSVMRTRNGRYVPDDDRNQLIFQYSRFVEALHPKCVMLENVPGLGRNKLFKKFLSRMSRLGYKGDWRVLNTVDFGVPQRRKRLIYIASRVGKIQIHSPKAESITVREALRRVGKAGQSGDPIHDLPEQRSERIKKMISLVPKDGGSREQLPEEHVLNCHKRHPDGFKDVYGRMAWSAPAPTITGGCASPSKGRFLHPEEDRCITLREAALLQGFTKDYTFPHDAGKGKLALMIGNALPPPFIQAHASDISAHLKLEGS